MKDEDSVTPEMIQQVETILVMKDLLDRMQKDLRGDPGSDIS